MCIRDRTNTVGLYGENGVEGAHVVFRKGKDDEKRYDLPIDGFFLAIGHTPNTDIFKGKLDMDNVGSVSYTHLAAWKEACQYETYYLSLDGTKFAISQRDCMIQLSIMSQLSEITKMVDKNLAAKQKTQVDNYYRIYIGKGGQAGE